VPDFIFLFARQAPLAITMEKLVITSKESVIFVV
jgi:hypothetical protein